MKIRKGDTVKILSGKDKGKTAVVEKSFPLKGKIVVKGVNVVKRHTKVNKSKKEGGIISKEMPVFSSIALVVCPKCQVPSRVGFKIVDSKKYRMCKSCKEII